MSRGTLLRQLAKGSTASEVPITMSRSHTGKSSRTLSKYAFGSGSPKKVMDGFTSSPLQGIEHSLLAKDHHPLSAADDEGSWGKAVVAKFRYLQQEVGWGLLSAQGRAYVDFLQQQLSLEYGAHAKDLQGLADWLNAKANITPTIKGTKFLKDLQRELNASMTAVNANRTAFHLARRRAELVHEHCELTLKLKVRDLLRDLHMCPMT